MATCLVSVACKRDEPRRHVDAAASASATAPNPSAVAQGEATIRSEARAKEVLDAWLLAQNAGDFPAYEKLYARRFTGIKRIGARMQRFDRDGWMKDRQGMFQRAFSVRVDETSVSATGASAVVEFTQTWSSASFRDVGKKQLVLSLEEGNLRIASEEMKSSSAGAVSPTQAVPKPEEFAFVVQAPGPLLVLSTQVDLNAVHGALHYVTDELARRPIAASALAREWRDLLGTHYTVYGDSGAVCEATVGDFEVLVSLRPHFGSVNVWNGVNGPVASPADRALDIWHLSEHGGRFLVARLHTSSACEGASWARATSLSKPLLWSARSPTSAEQGAILQAVRRTEVHRELQKGFEQAFKKSIPWDDSGSPPRFRVFEGGAGQTFAALSARSGVDISCGSPFDAQVFFLLQKRGDGWVVVSAPPEAHVASAWPRYLEPLRADQAFDLDGDGRPEFVGWMDLIRESGGTYRSVLNRSPGYFDCPC